MQHGWKNAQNAAAEMFGHHIAPTCKGSNERDQIWLSPEALQLLRGLWLEDVFVDHPTLAVQLMVPTRSRVVHKWPRPARLPWSDIDQQNWNPTCSVQVNAGNDSTKFLQCWAMDFENAVFNMLLKFQTKLYHHDVGGGHRD